MFIMCRVYFYSLAFIFIQSSDCVSSILNWSQNSLSHMSKDHGTPGSAEGGPPSANDRLMLSALFSDIKAGMYDRQVGVDARSHLQVLDDLRRRAAAGTQPATLSGCCLNNTAESTDVDFWLEVIQDVKDGKHDEEAAETGETSGGSLHHLFPSATSPGSPKTPDPKGDKRKRHEDSGSGKSASDSEHSQILLSPIWRLPPTPPTTIPIPIEHKALWRPTSPWSPIGRRRRLESPRDKGSDAQDPGSHTCRRLCTKK